jgi:FkbH-like protein
MAERKPATVLCLADFNADTLAALLTQDAQSPAVQASAAPLGQVPQLLLDGSHACWQPRPEVAMIWARPEAASESFRRLLEGESVETDAILADVDAFAGLLAQAAPRAGMLLVPAWTQAPHQRGLGLLDLKPGIGVGYTVMRMNTRLADQLASLPNAFMLPAQRWIDTVGKTSVNPKLWYMAKAAFSQAVLLEAVRDVKAAIRGVRGEAKKLVIVDLDDTLWGGLVGETGWEQITLGGHDPFGESFVEFQRALKALSRRGILLGIVSKNDETAALEALRRHPEMILRPDDFAGWRINWDDKAKNVAELTASLNLGLQSVVFIDDHPAERSRVREALPEVLVPDWPEDKLHYAKALVSLDCFDAPVVSQEDRVRTALYATERKRESLRASVGSVEEWLKTLGLTVIFEALSKSSLPRATQLLNKTNQMNLSTRRLTETELWAWSEQEGHRLWTLRVADRFGDAGLTGLLGVATEGRALRIVDFVLSCRVMGRKIEEAMMAAAVEAARSLELEEVTARYLPTAKNRPCLEFWQRSGFAAAADAHTFRWSARHPYEFPAQVTVKPAAPPAVLDKQVAG